MTVIATVESTNVPIVGLVVFCISVTILYKSLSYTSLI
jgi:hypothetical protein